MCFLFELTSAQANNQWNIGAELGSDPMESAFALTLTSGIKGVAMVLDREVQPLTSGSTNCGACQEVKEMYLSLSHSVSFSSISKNFLGTCTKKNLCPKSRDFRAEEFGVYSNISCPAGSTWSWFLSPTLV